MSIKKVAQDGEYHHLLDKKKFLFLPFLTNWLHIVFHDFLMEKFGKSKKKHPQKTTTSFNKTDAITIFFASKKSTGE